MKRDIGLHGTVASQVRKIYNQVLGNFPGTKTELGFLMPKGTTFSIERGANIGTHPNQPVFVQDLSNITNGTRELRQAQSNFWGRHGVFTNELSKITVDRVLYVKITIRAIDTTEQPLDVVRTIPAPVVGTNSVIALNNGSIRIGNFLYRTSQVWRQMTIDDYRTSIASFGSTKFFSISDSGGIITSAETLNDVFVDRDALSEKKPTTPFRFTLNHGSANRIYRYTFSRSSNYSGPLGSFYYCGGIPDTAAGYSDYFLRQSGALTTLNTAVSFTFGVRTALVTPAPTSFDFDLLFFPQQYKLTLVSGAASVYAAAANTTGALITRGSSVTTSTGRLTNSNTAFFTILIPSTETATSSTFQVELV